MLPSLPSNASDAPGATLPSTNGPSTTSREDLADEPRLMEPLEEVTEEM